MGRLVAGSCTIGSSGIAAHRQRRNGRGKTFALWNAASVNRSEAETIYDAGRAAVVDALVRLDRQTQVLSARLLPYARRSSRDRRLSMQTGDHVEYYRAIMSSDIKRGPDVAVGAHTREPWLAAGQMQLDYLPAHDLRSGPGWLAARQGVAGSEVRAHTRPPVFIGRLRT
jgi:hypothetical protein